MTATATLKMLLLGEDKSASKAIRGIGTEAGRTEGKLKSFGRIAAGAFTGVLAAEAARKVGEFLKGSVEAAVEDAAAQRKLAVALKNTTGATNEQIAGVESWISRQSLATGVADDELRPAFQRLAESTGSVSKAQRELGLAMDVSAGTGKSLEAVSTALMKANNGSVSGLARLGIKTKNAAGETMNLRQALKAMSDTFKGQAEARAKSMEGQLDRLKVAWQETKEAVGAKLLPVLMRLGTWLFGTGIPAAKAMAQSFGQTLGPAFDKVKGAVSKLAGPFQAVVGFIKDNPAAAKAFAITLGVLGAVIMTVSAAMWVLDAALAANPIGLVVIAIAALVAGFVLAYQHSEKFRAIVQAMGAAMKWLASAIGWVIRFVRDHWKEILAFLVAPLAVAVYEVHKHWDKIKEVIAAAIPLIVGVVKSLPGKILAAMKVLGPKLWSLIKTVWSKYLEIEKALAMKAWAFVKTLPGKYVSALKVLGPLLWTVVKAAFSKLVEAQAWGIAKAVSIAKAAPAKIANALQALAGLLASLARAAMSKFASALQSGIGKAVGIARSIPGKIKSAVGNLGSLLYAAGRAVVQGLINGIESMIGAVKDKLHTLTSLIPDHKGPIEKDRLLLRPAGIAIIEGLIEGLTAGEVPLKKALERVTDAISKTGDKIKDLLGQQAEWISAFQGTSVFGADYSAALATTTSHQHIDPETGEVTTETVEGTRALTAADIIKQQQADRAKARAFRDALRRLKSMHLSKDLWQQLKDQGMGAYDQVIALASGSQDQIRQLNHLNAQTQNALGAAGQVGFDATGGTAALASAREQLAELKELRNDLNDLKHKMTDDGKGGVALTQRTAERIGDAVERGARAGVGGSKTRIAARRRGGGA